MYSLLYNTAKDQDGNHVKIILINPYNIAPLFENFLSSISAIPDATTAMAGCNRRLLASQARDT